MCIYSLTPRLYHDIQSSHFPRACLAAPLLNRSLYLHLECSPHFFKPTFETQDKWHLLSEPLHRRPSPGHLRLRNTELLLSYREQTVQSTSTRHGHSQVLFVSVDTGLRNEAWLGIHSTKSAEFKNFTHVQERPNSPNTPPDSIRRRLK